MVGRTISRYKILDQGGLPNKVCCRSDTKVQFRTALMKLPVGASH
jgi:hypothetical protein